MLAKQQLCLRGLALLALSTAGIADCAAELQTYRIESNQPRLLKFSGGLLDYRFSAQLSGSFDVEVEHDGMATLTRFDVEMIDILNQGSIAPGWADGQPLASVLFVNPVGLTGVQDSILTYLSSQSYPPSSPILSGPLTTVRLFPVGGPWARLHIQSLPASFQDNPQFHTGLLTDEINPGFLVRLVPEPSGLMAVLLGAISLLFSVRSRRP